MALFQKKEQTPAQMHETCQKAWEYYDKGKYEKAASMFQPLADRGFAEAQNAMGILCKNGKGVAQNIQQAIHWFYASAGQEYAAASYNLGNLYSSEKYQCKNEQLAFEHYLRACDLGHTKAHYETAVCYQQGIGTAKNLELAINHFISAAVKGHEKADKELKDCFTRNEYLPYLEKYILPYYKMLGQKGDKSCCQMLCQSYLNGIGVAKNTEQAMVWAKKGAELGDFYCIGVCDESLLFP